MQRSKLSVILSILCLFSAVACEAASKSTLVANLESGKSQTVVTYGTSLTDGAPWVSEVQAALELNYPSKAKLINSAKSGMWSKWGAENLDQRVIANKPDTVIIEFSINDAYLQYKTSVQQARGYQCFQRPSPPKPTSNIHDPPHMAICRASEECNA